ncbi:MAG: hypothetical protein PWP37_530 [Thermotogota bacterium]|nr:hypothetical protein [Thermotogota bacterium]MDK2864338.1 hypothetical protein [Thermotogota bacterium]HCZ05589.1 transcription-repair coupling factor [Thermotogota bacterium]
MNLSNLVSTVEAIEGFVFVVVSEESMARDLSEILGGSYFPAHDVFPFDPFSPSSEVIKSRLQVVKQLYEKKSRLFVGTLRAFLTPTISVEDFTRSYFKLRAGDKVSPGIADLLSASGYRRSFTVRTPGQFAIRGMIVDVFDLLTHSPYRMERDEDTLLEINLFDPLTQRSVEKVDVARIFPSREWLFTQESMDLAFKRLELVSMEHEELDALLDRMPGLTQKDLHCLWKGLPAYSVVLVNPKRCFEALGDFLEEVNDSMTDTVLKEAFFRYSFGKVEDFLTATRILRMDLEEVWTGRRKVVQKSGRQGIEVTSKEEIEDFEFGEPVVHEDYGVGVCEGVKTMDTILGKREYLVIRYRDGFVYVPLDMFHKVHKYIGTGFVQLDSVSPLPWKRRVESVRKELEEQIRFIARLYALKRVVKRPPFPSVPEFEERLRKDFPFPETEGQKKAIEDVLSDLESDRPMDRLVTGDAGYGKTEVAIRAAMRVVANGGQVVVLAPTTILARQHFRTFKERLGKFGVKIAALDGRTPDSERKTIFESVSNGSLDVLIGTHAVLSNKLKFANLGLIIVDEEQRFGVNQKEKLRRFRESVDYLSISATPIPRTLQLALSGIKDLSVISTPPVNRKPVITTVAPYSERIVRSAILRELERGGQVLYVHNRVADLERIAKKVASLVPHARVAIVHGRMGKSRMTSIAEGFHAGEIDVLVATSVVQFGLDEPNANTIIVDDAYRYGISDLYQLRGRVGRSDKRAFAYFLYDPAIESKVPRERLRMIKELQKPGSAFRLALMDLEVRGAGEILGLKQHGKIDSVGLIMYNRMLSEIVQQVQSGNKVMHEGELILEGIPVDLVIPADYVEDTLERVRLYRRLSAARSHESIDDLESELRERFGPLPESMRRLLRYVKTKIALSNKGFCRVKYDPGGEKLIVELAGSRSIDLRHLARWKSEIESNRLVLSPVKSREVMEVLEFLSTL